MSLTEILQGGIGRTESEMEDHTCDMCGEDNERLIYVAGVGMICESCERREFGPFEGEDA